MTQYTKEFIETEFKRKASIRISQKKRGENKYAKDAGYWDGGRCNWGGAHNLAEDCETLAKFFAGIAELKNARQELTKFNNQQEFEKNKQDLLNKTNQALNGLQMKTGSTTSIGGVCCIWSDFKEHFEGIVNNFRKDVERIKNDIERVPYNEAKELQKLEIEERNLKKEIEENERKALNETDPNQKKKFLFLVDQAKENWKKILERKKQLKTARLGDNFNPDQHIDNFLQKLEEKLTPKDRPTRPNFNPRQPNQNPVDPNNPNPNTDPKSPFSAPNYSPNSNSQEEKPFLEKYFREILLIGGFCLAFYYISSQKDSHG